MHQVGFAEVGIAYNAAVEIVLRKGAPAYVDSGKLRKREEAVLIGAGLEVAPVED